LIYIVLAYFFFVFLQYSCISRCDKSVTKTWRVVIRLEALPSFEYRLKNSCYTNAGNSLLGGGRAILYPCSSSTTPDTKKGK
jgi:hypothetical protein